MKHIRIKTFSAEIDSNIKTLIRKSQNKKVSQPKSVHPISKAGMESIPLRLPEQREEKEGKTRSR